ncbi:hypothetical protein [Paenibacillus sp. FSL R7-0331]|uniref:hypothetical protein n=1 Tax=Paenibacillus sp. FSL R7-0331 TaxID=1536773 RepID=UPI0004F73262|nr:hypothetical protein [Paenibacillus sp. FSL R7-0331]AIQ51159.1 hypothetical protein R70331_06280 [Paenibacillus sp. FSL R7-0331]
MRFLPTAKNNIWFRWMAVYGLLFWAVLLLYRFVVLAEPFDMMIALRFGLLALVVSGLFNLLGWLGGRLVWCLSTAGLITGLVLMFSYSYRDMSGWEDLAGFLTFVLFTMGGFALGLAAEGIYFLVKHRRQG